MNKEDSSVDLEFNSQMIELLKECPKELSYSKRYQFLVDKYKTDIDKLKLINRGQKEHYFIDLDSIQNPEEFIKNELNLIQQKFDEENYLNDYILKITNGGTVIPEGKYNIKGEKDKNGLEILDPENIKQLSKKEYLQPI